MLINVAVPATALILTIVLAWVIFRTTRSRVAAAAIGILATILISVGVQWWTGFGLFAVAESVPPPIVAPEAKKTSPPDDSNRKRLLATRNQAVVEDITPILKKDPELMRDEELMAEVLSRQIDSGHRDTLKLVLDSNPKLVNKRLKNDEFNGPALHYAASKGDIESVKYILSTFPDGQDSLGGAGETCLQAAIRNRRMEMIEYLANNFPTVVRLKSSTKETAIHSALRTRFLWEERNIVKVVSILVTKAPDLAREPNGSGQMPEQILRDLGEVFLFPEFAEQLPEVEKLLSQDMPAGAKDTTR